MQILSKEKRLTIIVYALAIAVMFSENFASAQPSHPGGRPHKVKGHPKMNTSIQNQDMSKHILANAEIVGLTKEQRKQIRDLALETKKKNILLNAERKILQLEIHSLLTSEVFEDKKLEKKADEISQINADIIKQRVIGMIDVMKILTAKQRSMINSKHGGMYPNPLFKD